MASEEEQVELLPHSSKRDDEANPLGSQDESHEGAPEQRIDLSQVESKPANGELEEGTIWLVARHMYCSHFLSRWGDR